MTEDVCDVLQSLRPNAALLPYFSCDNLPAYPFQFIIIRRCRPKSELLRAANKLCEIRGFHGDEVDDDFDDNGGDVGGILWSRW